MRTTIIFSLAIFAAGLQAQSPQDDVVNLVNQERARLDCPAMQIDLRLTLVAIEHANDIARTGNVTRKASDGADLQERVDRSGYKWRELNETMIGGPRTANEVTQLLTKNGTDMLQYCPFNHIGIGSALSGKGFMYWDINWAWGKNAPSCRWTGGC